MSNITNICINGTTYGIGSTGQGVSEALKIALLQLADKVAYIDEDGQDYYDTLNDALYPPAGLVSITAVYTQSGTVYNTDSLDSLKSDLIVTAYYDNGTSSTVVNYTLSGTLTPGTSVVTATYGDKTASFNVIVTRDDTSIYNWDFTQGLTDSKQGAVATIVNATQSSNGITIDSSGNYIYLANMADYGTEQFSVEIDFGNFTGAAGAMPVSMSNVTNFTNNSGLFAVSGHWAVATTSASNHHFDNVYTDMSMFDNKTLKFQYDAENLIWKFYADNELMISDGDQYKNLNARVYYGLSALPVGTVVKAVRIYGGIE